jgi:hypothetical protein
LGLSGTFPIYVGRLIVTRTDIEAAVRIGGSGRSIRLCRITDIIMTDSVSSAEWQIGMTLSMSIGIAVLVLFNLEKVPELIRGIRHWWDGEG